MSDAAAHHRGSAGDGEIVLQETAAANCRIAIHKQKLGVAGFIGQQVTYGSTPDILLQFNHTTELQSRCRSTVNADRLFVG